MHQDASLMDEAGRLSPTARRVLLALGEVAMPAGQQVPAVGEATLARLEVLLQGRPASWRRALETLVRLLDQGARLRQGRSFSDLSPVQRDRHLQALFNGTYPERQLLRFLLTPLKVAHYADEAIFARLGGTFRLEPPVETAPPRYLARALDASSWTTAETIEADVVVVGSGAGGAAVAAELASMGLAVVILEEGGYFRRPDFTGRPLEMMARMYRDGGLTATLGNCVIPVPMGRCVGGTTTVNSGTCFRTPARVLARWREEQGLTDFTPEAMEPYFAKVESVLQVTRADPRHVGPTGAIIARGCEALGFYRHGPLARNAPDCDGSALCCFGCPTDAKRSSNISFIPLALRGGAQLLYHARVERILVDGGAATGVIAATAAGGRITVRGRAVVLAAGTLMTPTLLLRNRLLAGSGQVGRNLTIHPAIGAMALMPGERVGGARSIPQGYGVEQFQEEGLLFEGAFAPLDLGAGAVTFFGPRYTEVMEAYDRLAYFGFMIEETSRGRVRLGPGGRPLMTYLLGDHDVAQLKRGLEILARIFLAAGAESVFPMVPGFVELRGRQDLARLRRARLRARDFELTAHHPLGTARMGVDPRTSVVGPTGEAHELPGLFICDGAAVPSCLGVNPQVTIMALALRAAAHIGRAVER